ncbi:hypothetical protein ACTJKN_05215 [Pedobacter sp. 22163]|uniref:hypothetical protein n=1 Tax=Pedobacter sp. 22163 TaxID=3453883 RepID=UPI003F85CDC5
MKSSKILIFVTAIAMVSVTASKSFGSPGEHKEPVATEVTVKSGHLNFNLVTPEVFNPLISVEMIKIFSERSLVALDKLDQESSDRLIARLTSKTTNFEKEVLCSPHLGDAMDALMIKKGNEEKLRKPSLSSNPSQAKAFRKLRQNIF